MLARKIIALREYVARTAAAALERVYADLGRISVSRISVSRISVSRISVIGVKAGPATIGVKAGPATGDKLTCWTAVAAVLPSPQ